MSHDVDDFIHVFNLWNSRVGKGDVVIDHVGLRSWKKNSLVTSLGEFPCSWIAGWVEHIGDTSSPWVVTHGMGSSNKGNHFLSKMSKIGLE